MVTICQMSKVNYAAYDEVWAIVRSLKYGNPRMRHVPELSPSWSLFKRYITIKEEGNWNEHTFQTIYVPQFLKEMRGKVQQDLLNELFNIEKHICLVCFCGEEELCHRSIIGGMLQGAGLEVKGLSRDYSHYYDWWKNGVPGISNVVSTPKPVKQITDYNDNITFLYKLDSSEKIFNDDIVTMCFTGRRPKDLCWYDTAKYQEFASDLAKIIYDTFYISLGVRRFISGGAQGFDQMSFWAIERMKTMYGLKDVQNIVFVPFEQQEIRWAEKGCFSQTEYWMMIKKADQIVVVCDDNSIEALFARNHAMCDYSKYCLGLYPDDNWRMNKGGTAECMRYAAEHCFQTIRLEYMIDNTGMHAGILVKV